MFCILNLLPGMTQCTRFGLLVTLPTQKQTNEEEQMLETPCQ